MVHKECLCIDDTHSRCIYRISTYGIANVITNVMHIVLSYVSYTHYIVSNTVTIIKS